jgi:large subunit ribosomal protein L9
LKQRAHKEAKVISDAQAVADALKNIEIVAKAGGKIIRFNHEYY